ncbi:FGF intracellular binding protein [Planoprotostelium fungivorum]|uniref:FGF intracellular binding protein n=1 Tax=Planoprotostelium fungivorum TaxID=1890364 RepID=A0A2P6ND33_9EUKA|nr:FGF intracellular binding protein [Planoprotostelium fungivorum]
MELSRSADKDDATNVAASPRRPDIQQQYHMQSKNESKVKEDMRRISNDLEDSWKASSYANQQLKITQWKKEKLKLDVFVTSPILIDQWLFESWLAGNTAKQAATQRRAAFNNTTFDVNVISNSITRETYDQFRNFELVERYLQHPDLLDSQSLIVIEEPVFKELVKRYYAISNDIIRGLAGRKLKNRNRSSLDEACERLRIPLTVARRQFDNLKRIYTVITEKKREGKIEGKLGEAIQKTFLLPPRLAERYARNVFLCYHQIETDDKRLRFLQARDLEFFASVMMNRWTKEGSQLEIDLTFKEDLRDLRTYLLGDKNHLESFKGLVMESMRRDQVEEWKLSKLADRFVVIAKVLLNIGAGMLKSKEFEDIFEDIEEKVTDALIKMGMIEKDITRFFSSLSGQPFEAILHRLTIQTRHKQRFLSTWPKFVSALMELVLHFYSAQQAAVAGSTQSQNMSSSQGLSSTASTAPETIRRQQGSTNVLEKLSK